MAGVGLSRWLSKRTVIDIVMLIIALTVCLMVLGTGALTAYALIWRPDIDVRLVINQTTDIINTLIGLMAGFLAGRSVQERKPGELDL